MINSTRAKFTTDSLYCARALERLRASLSAWLPNYDDCLMLVRANRHPLIARRERTVLIIERVRQIAGIFALLTLAWIIVDAVNMAWPLWAELALDRTIASLGFAYLAIHRFDLGSTRAAYAALSGLVIVPLLFYLLSIGALNGASVSWNSSLAATTAYHYLPIIVAAGLSIFPLTALEALTFGFAIVTTVAAAAIRWPELIGAHSALATLWRLALISGISAVAGISQLRFLLLLTEQATRDGLTGLLTRRSGEETLNQQLSFAARQGMPFAVLFLDIDHFKQINDRFGHTAGDEVLQTVAARLRKALRRQDILVRWGGEEFLIGLPNTNAVNAQVTARRIAELGVARRPDCEPVTASIGIAERKSDALDQAKAIITLADKRMYAAKAAGRNRYCFHEGPQPWCRRPDAPVPERWLPPLTSQQPTRPIEIGALPVVTANVRQRDESKQPQRSTPAGDVPLVS